MTPRAAQLKRAACLIPGMVLLADALYLMREGQFHLGITLPFCLGAALVFFSIRWAAIQRRLDASPRLRRLWNAGWIAGFIWLCSLAVFFSYLAKTGASADTSAPRAIIVLGSGAPGGKASPTLAARLDKALVQAQRYPDVPVAVSGGQAYGDPLSEGRVMGDYLRARGLAAQRILQEERASSTEENLLFSLPLLREQGVLPTDPVRLVTSDFHAPRAVRIARKAGYARASAVGAPTPLYVRYNAWLREYFAYLSGLVLREYSLSARAVAASFPRQAASLLPQGLQITIES